MRGGNLRHQCPAEASRRELKTSVDVNARDKPKSVKNWCEATAQVIDVLHRLSASVCSAKSEKTSAALAVVFGADLVEAGEKREKG